MYELYSFLNIIFYTTIIPGTILISWLTGLVCLGTAKLCLLIFFLLFVVLPLIFRYSVSMQRGILFLTFIRNPKGVDLSDATVVGLYGTRSFFVDVEGSEEDDARIRIGVWHVLPANAVRVFKQELQLPDAYEEADQAAAAAYTGGLEPANEASDNELQQMASTLKAEFPIVVPENKQLFYERLMRLSGGVVVLYLHGNTGTRASGHRSEVYKLLQQLNYHVFAIDYRGYGDSVRSTPTEEGVVLDALKTYEYIAGITSNPIIVWGHSLGTGVATHMCSRLSNLRSRGPRGVILESPFTNIREEIRLHPFARPFRNLPWFDLTISQPMYSNMLRFQSDIHINEFRQPVMIIHAADDVVVPFQLGYTLYRIALDIRNRTWGPVEFHRFNASFGYGHKYLCRAPELPNLVKQFVNNYRNVIY